MGEGTSGLATAPEPTGVVHAYGWNSVADAGTDYTGILLRIRPIDGKNEVGDWTYLDGPMVLDNFTVFNEVNRFQTGMTRLRRTWRLTGLRSVVLTNGNVLLAGGFRRVGRRR